MISPNEEYQILRFVRRVIGAELGRCPEPELPMLELLSEPIACFVELIGIDGAPRGCIGNLEPFESLGENLRRHALNAAFGDPSFPPLEPDELDELVVSVSLVGPLLRIASVDEFQVGIHGILLSQGARRAVFLPRVIQEQRWGREVALAALSRKAGLTEDAWRQENTVLSVFELEVLTEASRRMSEGQGG